MKLYLQLFSLTLIFAFTSCSSVKLYEHEDALTINGQTQLTPVSLKSGEGKPIIGLAGRIPQAAGVLPGLVSANPSIAEVIYLDGNYPNALGHTAALIGKTFGTTTVYYVSDRRDWTDGAASSTAPSSTDPRLEDLKSFEVEVR